MPGRRCLLAALSLFALANSRAEDIDLFLPVSHTATAPNLLIVLDNAAPASSSQHAWKKADSLNQCQGDTACLQNVTQIFGAEPQLTQGQLEVRALRRVLDERACSAAWPADIRVGLMLMRAQSGAGVGSQLRQAVLPLDRTHCGTLLNTLDNLFDTFAATQTSPPGEVRYGDALFEAFKYFGGHAGPAEVATGAAGQPTGRLGFGPLRYGTPVAPEDPLAFSTAAHDQYQSPITAGSGAGCPVPSQLLIIAHAFPGPDDATRLDQLGYRYTPDPFAFVEQGRLADVWSAFLATADVSPMGGQQTLRTSVLNVSPAAADADQTRLLQSMAYHGRGDYFEASHDLQALMAAMRHVLTRIDTSAQQFTSLSLPPATQSGAPSLNQVTLGLFRPDTHPRWFGNLKLYRFVLDGVRADGSPNLFLGDSQSPSRPVVLDDGRLAPDSLSFWTHASTFWDYRCGDGHASGDPNQCGQPPSSSDSPDGAVVEKGGLAQGLREQVAATLPHPVRNLFTDTPTELVAFSSATVTPAQLGVASEDERNRLVDWVSGLDTLSENPTREPGPRPSLLGDIVHSEPVSVNYGPASAGCGADDAYRIVTFRAGNDGLLQAVTGGESGGKELWSLIPSFALRHLQRLRANAPPIVFPAPVPAGDTNKPYLVDGGLSVHAPDLDGDCHPDKVWLFVSMRRGGRWLYALDITQPTTPRLLWKKNPTDSGYAELGQTWSRPKPIRLADGQTYLIFGAGYDPDADDQPVHLATGLYAPAVTDQHTMGRGIFVVEAESGRVKRFFQAGRFSVPSEVAVVPNPSTGWVDRAYVGDTGGDVWKLGFPDAVPANWTITRIAALGDPTDLQRTGENARRFLYPPDVALCDGAIVLLIGSGDREKPFDQRVQNRFFQIRDGEAQVITPSDLSALSAPGALPDPLKKGWFFNLATGEKTVGAALTRSGTVHFPTHQPSEMANGCGSALGTARLYHVRCGTGGPAVVVGGNSSSNRFEVLQGGGFPASPAAVRVNVVDPSSQTPQTVEALVSGPHVIGGRPSSSQRQLAYWYRENLD